MVNTNDVTKGLSDDQIIELGIKLIRDGDIKVDDVIKYVNTKERLERKYGKLDSKYGNNKS